MKPTPKPDPESEHGLNEGQGTPWWAVPFIAVYVLCLFAWACFKDRRMR